MRKVLLAVTVLLVACIQAARADVNPNAAPADEYFGPYKQSVLEIRNRLQDYDKQDVHAMLDPSVPTYLDHLQSAIRDWQSKYPRDPWLSSTLAHLIREYWRAGQASSVRGMAALADMRSAYPTPRLPHRPWLSFMAQMTRWGVFPPTARITTSKMGATAIPATARRSHRLFHPMRCATAPRHRWRLRRRRPRWRRHPTKPRLHKRRRRNKRRQRMKLPRKIRSS